MPDTQAPRRGGKRERLVASASDLVHRQGVQPTTLAQVAEAAEVPPGNVYYYFKTKDELVSAVISSWADQFAEMLATLEARRTPRARLKALARSWADMRDLVARYGCPLGTLTSELEKTEEGLDREAAQLMLLIVDWAERQFREIGRRDARELAITLLAGIQGAAQLANAFRDPGLMTQQVRCLERWIDQMK